MSVESSLWSSSLLFSLTLFLFVHSDGLGYHDDGDYDIRNLAANDDGFDRPKTSKGAAVATLTKEALRKARKTKALQSASNNVKSNDDDGGEEGAVAKNASMWDFVNKGAAASIAAHPGNVKSGKTGSKIRNQNNKSDVDDSLEDLLSGLDNVGANRSVGGRSGDSRHRSSTFHRNSQAARQGNRTMPSSSHRAGSTRDAAAASRHGSARKRRAYGASGEYGLVNTSGRRKTSRLEKDSRHHDKDYEKDYDRDNETDDDRDNEGGHDLENPDMDVEFENVEAVQLDMEMESHDNCEQDRVVGKLERNQENHESPNNEQTTEGKANGSNQETDEPTSLIKIERPSSRPKLNRLSAAAARAKEAQERAAQKKMIEAQLAGKTIKTTEKSKSSNVLEVPITVDLNSTSFRPEAIALASASASSGMSEMGGNNNSNLETIVQMEESRGVDTAKGDNSAEIEAGETPVQEPRSYIDLFWLDASDHNGVVYLYGKVKVPLANATTDKASSYDAADKNSSKEGPVRQPDIYQSCCVTIPNNQRNLFVLPRFQSSSTSNKDHDPTQEQDRYPIAEVYTELKSVLQPSCIPHVQGATWGAKPVTRSYAFEDPSIPRGKCQYLKVVYDAKYPVPNRDICM